MFKTRLTLLKSAIAILAIITAGAFLARNLGWYADYWFTDVILHTLSGAMFALFWLSVAYKQQYVSRVAFFLSLAMAGAFGSYFWEVWEYFGVYLVPVANEAYIPELGDSLGDIACGIIGALAIAVGYWPKARSAD